jgi:tRNA dimethylallyltransferase
MENQRNLLIIVGPTAVGKTETAILLAERLDAEIISADSRLLYRGMDIGTAKPSLAERARVRHHMIDIADPDEIWSLAVYQSRVHEIITGIHNQQRLPILVGGTGQYVRAFSQGWMAPIAQPEPELRRILENWSREITPEGLHKRLAILDPQAATQIDFHNVRRTIRALEVILLTGQLFSVQRINVHSPYRLLTVGLTRPRSELYDRIDSRIDKMFSEGLIYEVEALLSKGYSPGLPSLSAIGYREVIEYLSGSLILDQAIAKMKKKTRNFVRRQANWFKPDDPDIHWFDAGNETINAIEAFVKEWIEQGDMISHDG